MYLNEKVISRIYYLICSKVLFHLSHILAVRNIFLVFILVREIIKFVEDHLSFSGVLIQDMFFF